MNSVWLIRICCKLRVRAAQRALLTLHLCSSVDSTLHPAKWNIVFRELWKYSMNFRTAASNSFSGLDRCSKRTKLFRRADMTKYIIFSPIPCVANCREAAGVNIVIDRLWNTILSNESFVYDWNTRGTVLERLLKKEGRDCGWGRLRGATISTEFDGNVDVSWEFVTVDWIACNADISCVGKFWWKFGVFGDWML